MAEIARKRDAITARGTQLAFVHMSREEQAMAFFAGYGMIDAERVSDPSRKLYRVFKLARGGWRQFLVWNVFKRGFTAGVINGHGLGKLAGDAFQMPGVFLIHQARILRSFVHKTVADRPNYAQLGEAR